MIEINDKRFHWLAGLLEGEASFMLTRSTKNEGPRATIKLNMTDGDIVQQVANIFQISATRVEARQANWNPSYVVILRGARAYHFMQLLQPLMGKRRQSQIQKVLAGYTFRPDNLGSNSNGAKLNEAQVRQIKRRIAQGETAKSIDKDFGVTHYNIWAIRCGKTWSHISLDEADATPQAAENPIVITPSASDEEKLLYWLAGLLEGEGSFLPPPPSAPNQPSVQMSMTDEDVVARAAGLLGVPYYRWQRKNGDYKASYQAQLRGTRAVEYMTRLYPLMGERRRTQIDRALAAYAPRDQRGENSPVAKLNTQQVLEIKSRLRDGEHPKMIAPDFGVNPYTIVDIKLGRTWAHIDL